jgi:hypothetical protein
MPHRPVALANAPESVIVNGRVYDAYIPTATKAGQWYWYTCEYDAAWVVFKTFGLEVGFEEQLALTGHDQDPEPWYEDTPQGVIIHGGDISRTYCGDYRSSILAKTRGTAMKRVFAAYGLRSRYVASREDVEGCLLRGGLIWAKVTVDFKEYIPATWVTTSGKRFPTVLANDHAVVVMGFNADAVVIRDVLGPTDTNWQRAYEYEVPWDRFILSMEAQGWDGRAVYPPNHPR